MSEGLITLLGFGGYFIAGFITCVILRLRESFKDDNSPPPDIIILIFWPVVAFIALIMLVCDKMIPGAVKWTAEYLAYQRDKPKGPPRARPSPPEEFKAELKKNDLT